MDGSISVSPEVKIPLAKSLAGHLLVNLTEDGLTQSQPLQDDLKSSAAYMVLGVTGSVGSTMSKTSKSFKVSNRRNPSTESLSSQSSRAAEAVVGQCENDDETTWMMQDEDDDEHHGDDSHEVHEGVFLTSSPWPPRRSRS